MYQKQVSINLIIRNFYRKLQIGTRVFMTCMTVMVTPSCTLGILSPDATTLVKEAWAYNEKQEYSKAEKCATNALKQDSASSYIYALRASIRIAQKRYPLALSDSKKSQLLNPKSVLTVFYKGLAFGYLGEEDSALLAFQQCINMKSDGGVSIDRIYLPIEPYESKTDVSLRQLTYYRGTSYYYTGQYKAALADFKSAAFFNFNLSDCHYFMGLIYYEDGQNLLGCKYWKIAIREGNKDAPDLVKEYCK